MTVNARLHKDDEKSLDKSQPIAVVSTGAVRRVEFVDNNQESFRSNALVLEPKDCSLYVMKPGCQERLRHRVRMDRRIKEPRISISFRAFIPECDRVPQTPSSAAFVTPDNKQSSSSPSIVTGADGLSNSKEHYTKELHKKFPGLALPGPPKMKPLPQIDHAVTPLSSKQHPRVAPNVQTCTKADMGYSPFPNTLNQFNSSLFDSTAPTLVSSSGNDKLCLLLGTSMTQNVDGAKMSKKGRTLVNLSSSGAKIEHVLKVAADFHYENPLSVHRVDKIVVSAGTNDIRWFNGHANSVRREFKQKLVELVSDLKIMFPNAHISFQTVLPIRIMYNYTVDSVHQFNNLLLEICSQYGCTFFDCFSRFLDREGVHPNKLFYRDACHLNDVGLKVLCRALKFLIYGNIFNPIPRYSLYSRFYPFHKH